MEENLGDMEEEKPSVSKKIFVIVLTCFLLIIVLVYFLTNPLVRNIIGGLIESSTLDDEYGVNIDSDSKLIFLNNSYNKLIEIYDENLGKEFKVCLKGKIIDGDYLINVIYEPEMFFQSYKEVVSEPCPEDSLVSMHTHPLKHCLPSQIDLESFEMFKRKNPIALMAIMCERGRFNFYR